MIKNIKLWIVIALIICLIGGSLPLFESFTSNTLFKIIYFLSVVIGYSIVIYIFFQSKKDGKW